MVRKPIVIFRFYKEPLVCMNRLELIRFYNPDIHIYGIYGGSRDELPEVRRLLSAYLSGLYVIEDRSSLWKWKNFDLVLREWYLSVGKTIDFDMAFTYEWDMLMFGSFAEIYPDVRAEEVWLTGIIEMYRIAESWYWTIDSQEQHELIELLRFVVTRYDYSGIPLACLGPGVCLPKSFLAKYSNMEVSENAHDEIRIPLYAQILKYPIRDTGFFRNWFEPGEKQYFNCDNQCVLQATIERELNSGVRRVFHPFRDIAGWKPALL